ncbi:MAG: PDGLE domain-containing protein, partial [Desulfobulbaceae bacterium]|nr:PDGLE domain-containing protein [Desulfobulbaceae bacterium]
ELNMHPQTPVHTGFAAAQEKISLMPDYGFKGVQNNTATSLSGLAGGALTLVLTGFIGILLKRRRIKF